MSAESVPTPMPIDTVSARRDRLFRESAADRARRIALGTAWALKPKRIGDLPALASLWLRDLVAPAPGLPDPERTLNRAGLCGMVHDLSPAALLDAYRAGLFTFAHYGPLKWLSPHERCVLFVDEFHLGKTTRRLVRLGRHRVTFDRDFEGVVHACAGRRAGKWHLTWITPRIMHAYAALHDAGHAHSFEVWNQDGDLVGGGYGVAIGGAFFTESLFSRERDASKIGFAVLNWHLAARGFVLNDGKWMNPLLGSMGYRVIPRHAFRAALDAAVAKPGWTGRWEVEADMATVAEWQPRRTPAPIRAAVPPVPEAGSKAKGTALLPVFGALEHGGLAVAETLCAVL